MPSYLAAGIGNRSRSFVPLDPRTSFKLYRDMRGSFPVLDVAITKLVRLCGAIEIDAPESVKEELLHWMDTVQVNAVGRGFDTWLSVHLDQMMQFGKGVGEIVPTRSRNEVFALVNLDPTTVELRTVPNEPLRLEVVQWQGSRSVVIPEHLVLVSAHNPQGDNPHGVSLYRSLPVVAEALSVIENATVQVWQRMGCPPYHVNWQPGESFSDPDGTLTAEFMESIKGEFGSAMTARTDGEVHDFFSSGNVTVDVIGNKNAIFDIQQPFRAFAEQIVAATGLPSWVFGFNWSATETLSVQQAEMIVANIVAIRRAVQPAIEYAIDLRQKLRGQPSPKAIRWSEVSLNDLTEQARGEAWQQQARARRIENARRMWELGWWDQVTAGQYVDDTLTAVDTPYDTPPGKAEQQSAALTPGSEQG